MRDRDIVRVVLVEREALRLSDWVFVSVGEVLKEVDLDWVKLRLALGVFLLKVAVAKEADLVPNVNVTVAEGEALVEILFVNVLEPVGGERVSDCEPLGLTVTVIECVPGETVGVRDKEMEAVNEALGDSVNDRVELKVSRLNVAVGCVRDAVGNVADAV